MNRTLRRGLAWLGIVGILLAQLAATAHACVPHAPDGAGALPIAIAADAETASGHCRDGAGGPVPTAPNLCAVHCTDGAAPAAAPDLPPVALAPMPAARVLAAFAASARHQPAPQPPTSTGVPALILRFGRLLI